MARWWHEKWCEGQGPLDQISQEALCEAVEPEGLMVLGPGRKICWVEATPTLETEEGGNLQVGTCKCIIHDYLCTSMDTYTPYIYISYIDLYRFK